MANVEQLDRIQVKSPEGHAAPKLDRDDYYAGLAKLYPEQTNKPDPIHDGAMHFSNIYGDIKGAPRVKTPTEKDSIEMLHDAAKEAPQHFDEAARQNSPDGEEPARHKTPTGEEPARHETPQAKYPESALKEPIRRSIEEATRPSERISTDTAHDAARTIGAATLPAIAIPERLK